MPLRMTGQRGEEQVREERRKRVDRMKTERRGEEQRSK